MTFGKKLETLRKQSDLSQEELADRLNVSRQAVSKWEHDTAMPDVKNIVLLSGVFGVSTDFLLKEDGENTARPAGGKTEDASVRHPALPKVAWAAIGLGLAGILILAILSSVCPAVIYDPPQGEVRTILRTGFPAFLELHRIGWLFWLCILLVVSGIGIQLFRRRKK